MPEEAVATSQRMVVLRRGAAALGLIFDEIGEIVRLRFCDLLPVEQRYVSDDVPRMPVKALICRDEGRRVIQVLDLGELLTIRNLPLVDAAAARTKDSRGEAFGERHLHRDKLIAFTVGRCALAIDMTSVEAVAKNHGKKPSIFPSELCDSMLPYKGRSIPIIRMSRLLQLDEGEEVDSVVVCRAAKGYIAFEVDQLTGIVAYSRSMTTPIPLLHDHRANIFHGTFTDREDTDFIVLNEEGLLLNPEVLRIANMHTNLSDERWQKTAVAQVPQVNLLTFRLGKLFGLKLVDVIEVISAPEEFSRAPNTPSAVLGVMNLRGTMIPILDPRQLFELEPNTQQTPSRLLIFCHQSRRIAMQVDSIESILPVSIGNEDELPQIFFNAEQPKMKDTFERGMKVLANGEKCVVMILSADQIVKRLAEAMAA